MYSILHVSRAAPDAPSMKIWECLGVLHVSGGNPVKSGVGKITNSYSPVNKKCHIIQNILYLYNPTSISRMI